MTLDGRPAPDIAAVVNELEQTGPIGKLVTVQLLAEYLSLLDDGRLEILFDDPVTNAGDGFAIDFVRLLVNPREWSPAGTVRGIALDARSRAPLSGVLVSAGNVSQGITGADGHNQDLSERRAASAVAWLAERGIAAERLQGEGHGDSMPVADNATEQWRALNRRVEGRDASR